jgi:propionate CoA-transferase
VAVVMKIEEAVKLVKTGDIIAINGFGSLGHPAELNKALSERFLKTGEPRELSLVAAAGQGVGSSEKAIDTLGHNGLLKKVIVGHWSKMVILREMVSNQTIEGYNLPQGVISHLFRAAAGRKPGILTKIGLNTVIDPRVKGPGLNSISKDNIVEVTNIDGEDYLFYKAIMPDVAFIRGTTADPKGNITMEKEAVVLEALSIAQAVKANKGKVIVQVERVSNKRANPREVIIPGILVDAIVETPDQLQTLYEKYNPAYTGEIILPDYKIQECLDNLKRIEAKDNLFKTRDYCQTIVAKRAAKEIGENVIINIGIGIPELVGYYAKEKATLSQICFTVESGTIGGVPAYGSSFGASINADSIYAQPYQFDFYDGGGLDVAFMGVIEVDRKGNINVSRIGNQIFGVGGFINITQSAKKVVFCFTFSVGGLEVEYANELLSILKEGRNRKFCLDVEEISFSGDYALEKKQEVIYITERCVLRLTKDGLELEEVAPGVDIEKDIIAKMPFNIKISHNLKEMDKWCFVK